MALIDRLRQATFKGFEFLVSTSSITFGQKTVVHQYPNTAKTEVEFLGAAEDIFTLDLYINSVDSDYIGRRNILKSLLSEGSPGLLVHPYEGEMRCSVVGQATLDEDDRSFGLARFRVTFQKTSLYLYPSEIESNIAKIRNLFLQLKNVYKNKVIDEYFFADILPDDFGRTKNFLTGILGEFEGITSIVSLNNDNEVQYNRAVSTFEDNIVPNVEDGTSLADDLDNLVSGLDDLAEDQTENILLYQSLYTVGTQSLISPSLTVHSQELNKNISLITNYINIMVLALSYNSIALVEFETDQDLNLVESILEAQYQFVFLKMDTEIAFLINALRNEITQFFDEQEVRRVIDENVPGNPLVKLTYLLYENLDDYQQLFELNDKKSPVWYEGDIKILTES